MAYYGGSKRHPGCPGGCGNLADECECRLPNPLGSMRISQPVADLPQCKWRGCTADAESRGYCDPHFGTL